MVSFQRQASLIFVDRLNQIICITSNNFETDAYFTLVTWSLKYDHLDELIW